MSMFRSYTETYDMNTESGAPTLLGIHTPIGSEPYRMLKPCYDMYRKVKYLGCDVTVVNAAKLPVSPESYSIQAGMNDIDPRDTLDPVMFIGCHGNDMGAVLNSMYGGLLSDVFKLSGMDKEKAASLETFYYTALGDEKWRKSPIQKTLHLRGLHPIVYNLATQMQLQYNNVDTAQYPDNIGTTYNEVTAGSIVKVNNTNQIAVPSVGGGKFHDFTTGQEPELAPIQLMTNKVSRLGWLDTKQIMGNLNCDNTSDGNTMVLPKVMMGILMLPPARRAYNFLRVIIRHKFKFASYRTVTTGTIDNITQTAAIAYNNQYTGNTPASSKMEKWLDDEPADSDLED